MFDELENIKLGQMQIKKSNEFQFKEELEHLTQLVEALKHDDGEEIDISKHLLLESHEDDGSASSSSKEEEHEEENDQDNHPSPVPVPAQVMPRRFTTFELSSTNNEKESVGARFSVSNTSDSLAVYSFDKEELVVWNKFFLTLSMALLNCVDIAKEQRKAKYVPKKEKFQKSKRNSLVSFLFGKK